MVTQMTLIQNLGQLNFPCSSSEVLFKKLTWIVTVKMSAPRKNRLVHLICKNSTYFKTEECGSELSIK